MGWGFALDAALDGTTNRCSSEVAWLAQPAGHQPLAIRIFNPKVGQMAAKRAVARVSSLAN